MWPCTSTSTSTLVLVIDHRGFEKGKPQNPRLAPKAPAKGARGWPLELPLVGGGLVPVVRVVELYK